jgi:hydroxymethylpyrimidine pyrophosphatase-like HAD family hydrolase
MQVRQSYADMTGRSISAERWFLLELVHLWDRRRSEPGHGLALSRACARASQRYFAESFFVGVASAAEGRLCALDLDGVLETESLGFSSLTACSAMSLRALLIHGFRPLLVTGRSVPEVRERCSAFGLAGGVAEYGSAFYDHSGGTVCSLVATSHRTELTRLREAFRAVEGIRVDDNYQHSVRVFRSGPGGVRLAPTLDVINGMLTELGLRNEVTVHAGDGQVDLVAAGVDKATGLTALLLHLGLVVSATGPRPLALAVGDGLADIPMFELAELAAAPAHARAAMMHAAVRVMSRPYQAGLADAVAALLGHRPGSCPICLMPTLGPDGRAVITLLSAQERGVRSMVLASISLAISGRHRLPSVSGRRGAITAQPQDPGT